MNQRILLIGLLAMVSLAGFVGAVMQHRQLTGLRAQLRGQVSRIQPASEPAESQSRAETTSKDSAPVSPELLRLRNEVTRLKGRVGELAAVRTENEQLHAALARQNASPPAGVILRRQARMVGCNSPEDTLQSLLWSIQQKDSTNFLQCCTPACAQNFRRQMGENEQSAEGFFQHFEFFVGFAVTGTTQMQDGLEVQVQLAPGTPPMPVHFRQVDGQWKFDGLPL
jgi:hypothetical protein